MVVKVSTKRKSVQKQVKLTRENVNRKLTAIQSDAVHSVMAELYEADRVSCVMACSTGKSRVGVRVIRRYQGNVSVICVPNLQLVQQFIGTITEIAAMKGHTILPVCSKIGDESPEDFDIHGATTDEANILAVCRGKQPVVVVVTYQSFHVFASAVNGKVAVDLLVADEAHRTAGERGKEFGACLHDSVLKIQKRLFMTATPVVYRGNNETVYSMSDPKVYGKSVFEYSYRDACEDGVVALAKTCIFSIPTGEAANVANKLAEAKQQAFLAEALHLQMLRPTQRTKMLVFHNSLRMSQAFTAKLRQMGVAAEHLNGEQTVAYRKQKIQEFSSVRGPSVICAVRVFSEGVDAPEINTIVFAEKKGSTVDITQSIGRGTRWSERTNLLNVIIPYFTDRKLTRKQVGEELIGSSYGPLSECMAALVSMEGSMTDYRVSKAASDDEMEEADDPGFEESPADEVPIVRRVSMVRNLPLIKVTIRTDEGEFDAEDVRRKYVAFMNICWATDRAELIKQVLEIFGPTRPTPKHPKYVAFMLACKDCPFTGEEILNEIYGGGRTYWATDRLGMIRQVLESFGTTRPTRKHLKYKSFFAACVGRPYTGEEILNEIYGGGNTYWKRDRAGFIKQAREIFGPTRPTRKHPKYVAFTGACKGRPFKPEEILNEIYGGEKTRWAKDRAGLIKQVLEIFGPTRPTRKHPKYQSFMHACKKKNGRPFTGKEILNEIYGGGYTLWATDRVGMINQVLEIFGPTRPDTKHPKYQSFKDACNQRTGRGFKAEEILDEIYGSRGNTLWATDRAGFIKQVLEIFGPKRPDTKHPKYDSFIYACGKKKGRSFKAKEILDAAYPETESANA